MLSLSDQWITPVVSGDCPPPCIDFTLIALTDNTFIMFGGYTPNGYTNSLYIGYCTKSVVVSIVLLQVYYKYKLTTPTITYYGCGSPNITVYPH